MLEKRVGEAAAAQEADANSWGNILMGGGGTGRRQGYGETFTNSCRTVAGSVGKAIAGAIFGRR